MASKNQQISLRAIFLLITFVCVMLYFVFAVRYSFSFHGTAAHNIVTFNSPAHATTAIGHTFSFMAAPKVLVECKGLARDPLEYLTDQQVNFEITITGTTPRTISEQINYPLPCIPITRHQFAIKLKDAIEQSFPEAECEVQTLGAFPFRAP
jgi:hypothetical protein